MNTLTTKKASSKIRSGRGKSKKHFFDASSFTLFRDQIDREWIWIPGSDTINPNTLIRIKSEKFCQIMNRRRKQIGMASFSQAEMQLLRDEYIASIPDNHTRTISPRFRTENDAIFIDLANSKNEMIHLDSSGWNIVTIDRPLFDRQKGQIELPTPIRGGNVYDLFDYLNIVDEDARLLVIVWLVAALDESPAKMMMVLVGAAGSGKSQTCQFLRLLIDPNKAPTLGEGRGDNWLLIMQNNAVVAFDNLGLITGSKSDSYCRAITGDSLQERRRYSDSEQVFYNFRRPILINGIHNPVTKLDLMDRSFVIELERVKSFVPAEDLVQQFREAHPQLLGALLDLAVEARRQKVPNDFRSEIRMASYARLGCRVSLALGKPGDAFARALKSNQRAFTMDITEENCFGLCITLFAQRHLKGNPWRGSMTDLITELEEMDVNKKLKSLPRSMSAASTQLKDLAEPLLNHGVVVKELPRTRDKRLWEIYHESLADSVQGSTDVSNDDDDLQDYFGDSLSLEESPEESLEE